MVSFFKIVIFNVFSLLYLSEEKKDDFNLCNSQRQPLKHFLEAQKPHFLCKTLFKFKQTNHCHLRFFLM